MVVDKFKCRFDSLIGKPYGFHYEIKDQQFTMVPAPVFAPAGQQEDQQQPSKLEIDRDNRNLVDNTENQKLTHEDIENMKTLEAISGSVSGHPTV